MKISPIDLQQKWDWEREQMLSDEFEMQSIFDRESHFCCINPNDYLKNDSHFCSFNEVDNLSIESEDLPRTFTRKKKLRWESISKNKFNKIMEIAIKMLFFSLYFSHLSSSIFFIKNSQKTLDISNHLNSPPLSQLLQFSLCINLSLFIACSYHIIK